MTHDGDIREQTRQTLANIDRYLAEAGSSKTRSSVTIYLRTWPTMPASTRCTTPGSPMGAARRVRRGQAV